MGCFTHMLSFFHVPNDPDSHLDVLLPRVQTTTPSRERRKKPNNFEHPSRR
eukprot:m.15881 g.15881  ORF g.15881 m.15881 type:complete len:51 (-) comp7913_c0_seq1:1767-1919(-)